MRYLIAALCGLLAALTLRPAARAVEGARQGNSRPIRALLVIGGCCHDHGKQQEILTQGISARTSVAWTIAYDPDTSTSHVNPVYPNPDWSRGFDVVVH